MVNYRLSKVKEFPRPHELLYSWFHGMETAVNNQTTILPLIMQDEGLGSPSAYKANPENPSFALASQPNCYPESIINKINAELTLSIAKPANTTDAVKAIRCAYMVIAMSFKEDYITIDELTSAEVQDVLMMQTESTDRQGYPLFNGVDMPTRYANSSLQSVNVPGLTTTQALEGVTFDINVYYRALQYYKISPKLRKCQFGLKWLTLTEARPVQKIKINIKSKAKRMNPFTFLGLLVTVPPVDTPYQLPVSTDTTNVNHVSAIARARYNEWNQEFDFGRT